MKVPLLILCLAVVYGTCRIYAEEGVNLKKNLINGENYKLNFPIMGPSSTSLSRHKRGIILSPLLNMAISMLGKEINFIVEPMLDLFGLVFGVLTGQEKCPRVEKLSVDLTMFLHPIQTIENVLCTFLNMLNDGSRKILLEMLSCFSELLRKILLPGLYRILNGMNKREMLPSFLVPYLEMFNVFYALLKAIGYIE